MFIQPCFIRRNTPELRKKLEEIGLQLINVDNTTLDCHNYDGKGHHRSIEEGRAIITYYSSHYGIVYDVDSVTNRGRIDCGINEQLFLALAALRDDTDKGHWFVLDTDWGSINYPESIIPKGTFIQCLVDKWNIDVLEDGSPNPISSRNIPAHKATVEELIEHFKNKK